MRKPIKYARRRHKPERYAILMEYCRRSCQYPARPSIKDRTRPRRRSDTALKHYHRTRHRHRQARWRLLQISCPSVNQKTVLTRADEAILRSNTPTGLATAIATCAGVAGVLFLALRFVRSLQVILIVVCGSDRGLHRAEVRVAEHCCDDRE